MESRVHFFLTKYVPCMELIIVGNLASYIRYHVGKQLRGKTQQ